MKYDVVIDTLMGFEGGVEDVGDGAGLTRWGQTEAWLAEWRLPIPESADEARQNYQEWLELSHLGALATPPNGWAFDALSDNLIDYAINAGEARAVRAVQAASNTPAMQAEVARQGGYVWAALKVDGVIGPKTLAAVLERSARGRDLLAAYVFADRLRHYGRITRDHPEKNLKFIAGWLNRMATLAEKWAA